MSLIFKYHLVKMQLVLYCFPNLSIIHQLRGGHFERYTNTTSVVTDGQGSEMIAVSEGPLFENEALLVLCEGIDTNGPDGAAAGGSPKDKEVENVKDNQ